MSGEKLIKLVKASISRNACKGNIRKGLNENNIKVGSSVDTSRRFCSNYFNCHKFNNQLLFSNRPILGNIVDNKKQAEGV